MVDTGNLILDMGTYSNNEISTDANQLVILHDDSIEIRNMYTNEVIENIALKEVINHEKYKSWESGYPMVKVTKNYILVQASKILEILVNSDHLFDNIKNFV